MYLHYLFYTQLNRRAACTGARLAALEWNDKLNNTQISNSIMNSKLNKYNGYEGGTSQYEFDSENHDKQSDHHAGN
jgi:hypothetical protein